MIFMTAINYVVRKWISSVSKRSLGINLVSHETQSVAILKPKGSPRLTSNIDNDEYPCSN